MAVGDAQEGLGGAVIVAEGKRGDGGKVGFDLLDDFLGFRAAPFVNGLIEISEEGDA